jgi:hypothetical protein
MANMVKSEQSIGYYERKNNGMNSISIAIYHTDEVYARALARGISSRWKQAAISVVRLENRAEWEGCDIVLFDEAYALLVVYACEFHFSSFLIAAFFLRTSTFPAMRAIRR